MSIWAELLADNTCKVCSFIASLGEDEQAEMHKALCQPTQRVHNAAVVRLMARRGVDIDEASVRRHRRNHE